MLRGMWDLPGPGLEPVSPALAGGFLTTAPPGKSPQAYFKQKVLCQVQDGASQVPKNTTRVLLVILDEGWSCGRVRKNSCLIFHSSIWSLLTVPTATAHLRLRVISISPPNPGEFSTLTSSHHPTPCPGCCCRFFI